MPDEVGAVVSIGDDVDQFSWYDDHFADGFALDFGSDLRAGEGVFFEFGRASCRERVFTAV